MILWMILFSVLGIGKNNPKVVKTECDLIRYNIVYSEDRRVTFKQYVFYKLDEYGNYNVTNWLSDDKEYKIEHSSGSFCFLKDRVLYIVRFSRFEEWHTDYDIEQYERFTIPDNLRTSILK